VAVVVWYVGLLDHVTVLIGIAVKGKAVAGVICQPYSNYEAGPTAAHGRIIWGIVGLGNLYVLFCCVPLEQRTAVSCIMECI